MKWSKSEGIEGNRYMVIFEVHVHGYFILSQQVAKGRIDREPGENGVVGLH